MPLPAFRIALMGNPRVKQEWTLERLERLAAMGFNAVQLNVAWLCRPHDEALNLRDVVRLPNEDEPARVVERREDLLERNRLAHAAGLRSLFHFGSPFMWRDPETGREVRGDDPSAIEAWYDVTDGQIRDYETALLRRFRNFFPDVDDILVYTYDQDAWQVPEFSELEHCRGVPLHERLPEYLAALHEAWTGGRLDRDHRFWWEPWELSAGQVYKCIDRLPATGFGMMLHSNIAEVQTARPADAWFRNTASLCHRRGIPVVAEGFYAARTEENEPLAVPCPRLVDEQYLASVAPVGVVGVKEYFGITPEEPDLNRAVFEQRMRDPEAATDTLLERVAARFGDQASDVADLMERLSEAYRSYPWDASWFAREVGVADIDHGWRAGTVRGWMVETPSWRSSRYAHFMKTDDQQPHFYLLEDVQLRCEVAADLCGEAIELARRLAQSTGPEWQDMFQTIAQDTEYFQRVCISYALHLRETNVAEMLRADLAAGRPMTPRLAAEMTGLLERDADNQRQQGRVIEMLERWKTAPEKFLAETLLPTNETFLKKATTR